MCGIAGLYRPEGGDPDDLARRAGAMADRLVHRGPDAGGQWADPAGVGFGHRRLSILDLSAAGAQPMRSACGRFTVTFNGEIYNHLDLRRDLATDGAAPDWRGHSDTETLLAAVCHWGLTEALQRMAGMFAFALWDASRRELALVRDRFGEKPLYYGWCGGELVFASELKALAAHPDWTGNLDRAALMAFMRYSCVPAPATIWQGIRKLPPGCVITFSPKNRPGSPLPAPSLWWSFAARMMEGRACLLTDVGDALQALRSALTMAVHRQMISDVPLGAFLSGGIDSTTIVALMQAQAPRPVRTFTIGFAEQAYDESSAAGKVAAHLKTDHTSLVVDDAAARDVIPGLATMYDEPFADSSQIPTALVCALARRHVTVALSGDGGDELFAGYNRHVWGSQVALALDRVPLVMRSAVARLLRVLPPDAIDSVAGLFEPVLPASLRVRRPGSQLHKLAGLLAATSEDELYRLLCSIDPAPSQVVIGGFEAPSWGEEQMGSLQGAALLERMTCADAVTYLADDILQKVDRAAMAVSLETRMPFLDVEVATLAARLSPALKLRDGRGKWLVRRLLNEFVPAALVDRPKTGFSVPLNVWLRGPLQSWADDLLSPARLQAQGLFDARLVEARWREHRSGRRDHAYWLWNVLMAQSWLDRWTARSPS